MNYDVVFDLAEAGYRTWWFPAFGLGVVVFSLLLLFARPLARLLFLAFPSRLRGSVPWVMLAFTLIWTTFAFVTTYREYANLRDALATGRYQTVEGTVRNFHPMPYGGHSDESFDVQGVHFAYSDYLVTAGFNNTASHGGPMAEGLQVRIAHVDGKIVRLEISR